MDDNLQQHYFDLWRLAQAVKEVWWEGQEKTDVLNFLENSTKNDPNLAHLEDPQSPDFLDDLSLTLQALLLNKSEIPSNNQPSQSVINDPQKSQFLKKLDNFQRKIPVAFRDSNGKAAGFSQKDAYLILKKHGVIDSQGNFDLSNLVAKQRAEREITKNFVRQYHRQSLEDELELSLVTEAPVGLFQSEFFGKKGIPGIVQTVADRFSEKSSEYLLAIMERRLGGVIDTNAPNFQTALDKAIGEVQTASRLGSLFSKTEVQGVITAYLQGSPNFNRLAFGQQDVLVQKATAAILGGARRTETPSTIHKPEIVQSPSGEISLKITSARYQTSKREIINFQALPTLPKNIKEKIVQEVQQVVKTDFNSGENIASTKKLQSFWEDLAADPLSAILHYPVNSILHLLPRPLQNLYFKQTGTPEAWKELQKKYFYATHPEGLRLFTQDMVWRGIKASLRPLGITNEKGQWAWASALGWMAEKTTTSIGEGLASITSHIPLVGGFLSKTFKRRLGKNRKRDEELATGILGIFLDIGLGILKILPKVAWRLINQIPVVKHFTSFVTQKYFALESRFGIFRTIRTVTGVTGNMIRGAFSLNTIAGAGWGYILTGGNPLGTLLGGAGGALYQGWLNIAKNGGLIRLLTRATSGYMGTFTGGQLTGMVEIPKLNLVERVFRVAGGPGVWMAEHGWARLPIKGSLVGYFLWLAGIPGPLAFGAPMLAQWLWETRGWWGKAAWLKATSRFPALGRIGGFFSQLGARFGFIGKFFGGIIGKIFFAIPYVPLLIDLLSGTSLQVALGNWFASGWGIWGVLQVAVPFLWGFIPAVLGYAGWGAIFVGAGEAIAVFIGGLGATIAGIGIGAVLATVAAVAVIALVVTIITASAFVQFSRFQEVSAPSVSECFSPTKTVKILDKNTRQPKPKAEAGDFLEYTITFGAKKPEIKNVVLKDDIREYEGLVNVWPGPSWDKFYVDPKTFKILLEPAAHTGPKITFDRGTPAATGLQEIWQRVIWENFSVTPATSNIIYEIKVSDKYQTGTILNQVLLNGQWTDPQGKEANCQVAVSGYVNSGTKEAKELAETMVNELKKCGISYVTQSNWTSVESCLSKAGIPTAAIDELKKSVSIAAFSNRLQCVGFVNAVEAATGGNLANLSSPDAKGYWRALSGYQQIYKNASTLNSLQPGDILIWTNGADGHMAIVVRPVFDSNGKLAKIVIAEAMGDTGLVRLREIAPDDPGLAGWQRRK